MEAINWGAQGVNNPLPSDPTHKTFVNHPGVGRGPWVMADLEAGVWGGDQYYVNPNNTPIVADYITAMVKGRSGNHWSIKGGDANAGPLKVMHDGPRPKGYEVMQKLGAIVLGIGGDNSDGGIGTFYEGAMTASYTTDEVSELGRRRRAQIHATFEPYPPRCHVCAAPTNHKTDAAVQANIVAAGYGK